MLTRIHFGLPWSLRSRSGALIIQRATAKAYELRAATSLTRAWREKVNGSEGIKLLASDYGWFTEGSMPAMLGLQLAFAGGVAMTECHGVYFNK